MGDNFHGSAFEAMLLKNLNSAIRRIVEMGVSMEKAHDQIISLIMKQVELEDELKELKAALNKPTPAASAKKGLDGFQMIDNY